MWMSILAIPYTEYLLVYQTPAFVMATHAAKQRLNGFSHRQMLVTIIRKRLNLTNSLRSMPQILSATSFATAELILLLTDMAPVSETPADVNQMILL